MTTILSNAPEAAAPDSPPLPYTVLVADKIALDGLAPLKEDPRFALVVKPGLAGEELARAIAEADAVIVRSATKIPREALAYATRLKVIGRAGVGVDTIDVEAATERGVAVLNAPAGNTISAAELAFALVLAFVRRIPAADRSMRAGEWERAKLGGTELYGKTLGLVGAGRIGGEVARRARAFGMRVAVYDPYLNEERARSLDVELAPLDDVLRRADVVSLHVPLTESTTGLVGDDALGKMKKTAILVNASRGEVVDEAALVRALSEKRIAGAALDVYAQEPLPRDHPLRALDNVVLTPHLAASTEEAQDRAGVIVAEQVAAALEGGLVTNAVNIPAIRGEDMEVLGPYVPLAAKLGRLAMELAGGRVERITLTYYGGLSGYDTRLLTVAALNGAFQGRSETPVNYVNAPLIAAERGIEVLEERRRASRDFTNLVRVEVRGGDERTQIAGTTIGKENRQWLVSALGFELELELAPLLVFFRYPDLPGVIGRVGTLFGEAGVNIANMTVSRTRRGGQALMALSIDQPAPPELVERLHGEFDDARFISMT